MEEDVLLVERAQGCLLGQLTGDSLGSLVEFQSENEILRNYPKGVRELSDGGTWNTIAGQPTDDSEMALLLARMLVKHKSYSPKRALKAYLFWLDSGPFDCGMTIASALRGSCKADSQANGALMRISPLGIFGASYSLEEVSEWAQQDAALTHPHPICQQANALFAMAIASAIKMPTEAEKLYQVILDRAHDMKVESALLTILQKAAENPPADFSHQQGWVLIAFQNALYQLLHAPTLEDGVVDTVMHGGDTDTNAAICGALLGTVYGIKAIPEQWLNAILNCRPDSGHAHIRHPRPTCFWPADALTLAENLVCRASH